MAEDDVIDIFDKILSARKEWNEEINRIRVEFSADTKELKSELLQVFRDAHADNRLLLQKLETRLEASSQKLESQIDTVATNGKTHDELDTKRFNDLYRLKNGFFAIIAVLLFLMEIYRTFSPSMTEQTTIKDLKVKVEQLEGQIKGPKVQNVP